MNCRKFHDERLEQEGSRMSIAATAERIVRETMIERGLKKPDARKEFLLRIDQPVFDRSAA